MNNRINHKYWSTKVFYADTMRESRNFYAGRYTSRPRVGGMSSDDSAGGCGNSSSSSSLSDGEVLPLPTPPVPDNSDTTGLRRQQLDAGTDPGQHHHHDHLQQALQAAVSHSPVVNGGSIPPLGMESQAAFMRRSFHKNPRLPGTYRLSKLNGCSRSSYADSESENDLPDNALCRKLDKMSFGRGSSTRQSLTSMRSLPAKTQEILMTPAAYSAKHERRRAFIPISTKMASRVISNATGDLDTSHVDCRDFTTHLGISRTLTIGSQRQHGSTPALHHKQRILEEVECPSTMDEPLTTPGIIPVSFVTFKPPYGRNSICSSDDCSTSEGSSSPHSTVRRVGPTGTTSSSPDLLKSSFHWLKDNPACRFSMSSQSSWFSDDELYSMRSTSK
ncbi:uncharacterized protein LOC111252104 isoform X1 [Varroa destructor]|uniref:Uncharacterized protein n=2 Tax=Varroa destructor TaxID=109461 RepID=A0A7M7KDM0_VARDE|nr:uncharacterized protein LOC111252104 isoform X1 [Varroa destructor]